MSVFKSSGPHGIYSRHLIKLKKNSRIIDNYFYDFCLQFLRSRVVPNYFELALCLLWTWTLNFKKKKNKSDSLNYRPISLMPVARKILEAILNDRKFKHPEKHNSFKESQCDFRIRDFCLINSFEFFSGYDY